MAYMIKNLELDNQFLLAPMAEINDIVFRLLCKKAGCALTYTGMINPLNPKELELEDNPAIQIFCTSNKGVKEFIKKYESRAALFDFNLGCPAKTAKKLGFGSFMHNQLDEIEKILKTMRESTKKPITIKLRKSKNVLKILKIANKYCDAIAIHPRTQAQGYSGEPDIEYAKRIKKRTKLPIIYSGNVNESNYQRLIKTFDFVMIGREAMGNPAIFSKLTGNPPIEFKDYLELSKKYKLKFSQIKLQAMTFTKAKENAKDLRREIVLAKNIDDIKKIFNSN